VKRLVARRRQLCRLVAELGPTYPSAKPIWQYEYHSDAFEGSNPIEGVSAKKFVQNFDGVGVSIVFAWVEQAHLPWRWPLERRRTCPK
jgi:hypothetical protein